MVYKIFKPPLQPISPDNTLPLHLTWKRCSLRSSSRNALEGKSSPQPIQEEYKTSAENLLQTRRYFTCLNCDIIARVGDLKET